MIVIDKMLLYENFFSPTFNKYGFPKIIIFLKEASVGENLILKSITFLNFFFYVVVIKSIKKVYNYNSAFGEIP